MPLRDHFRPPLDDMHHWEGLYGGWPAMMVVALNRRLPTQYTAWPRVHLGGDAQMDAPSETAYEVRVFEMKPARRLIAAVELVSPANKARPEHRRAFVAKCAALLQQRVSVTIVDPVTTHDFNLYRDLLELIGRTDPSGGSEPPLYAAACRPAKRADAWLLEIWVQPLALGQALPTLPLWIADDIALPLDLEESYEETCRILRIP